jgi:hypothetical protein
MATTTISKARGKTTNQPGDLGIADFQQAVLTARWLV